MALSKERIMKKLRELASIDIRALALMRISFASIILLDLITRAQFLVAHYTRDGVVTNAFMQAQSYHWPFSLHLLNDSAGYQAILFIVAGVFALMMLVGYHTRIATFASWLLLTSLHAANPFVLYGGDMELRVIMFFAMFIPWGTTLSLDSVRTGKGAERPGHIATFATFAFLLQIAFIYLFGSLNKTGIEWQDGSAVWYALSASAYSTPLGRILLSFPALIPVLTYGVFWLQRLCIFFLFSPFFTKYTRALAAVLLIGMQVAFLFTLSISYFPLVSITALLAFLPAHTWDFLEKGTRHVHKHMISRFLKTV